MCHIHVRRVWLCVVTRSDIIGIAFVRVYEHTCFSIFIMISSAAFDAYDGRTYQE